MVRYTQEQIDIINKWFKEFIEEHYEKCEVPTYNIEKPVNFDEYNKLREKHIKEMDRNYEI